MSKQFYIKQFSLLQVECQSQKAVPFQIIQLSITLQFKYKYGLITKNLSILSYSV